MANTTNFGWETPDDTDLVKDGALAMRTLGNAIDTSFVDLKGGTTGQNLRKNSNTDLDFTWAGDATNTVIDAEGDLLVGDSADTLQRLAIGTQGQVLTVDTAVDGKIKWATAGGGGFSGCSLYTTNASLAFTAYVATKITFPDEEFDTDGYHSTSTNTSRITIPSGKAGKYLFTFTIGTNTGIGGSYIALDFYKNGTALANGLNTGYVWLTQGLNDNNIQTGNGSILLSAAENDYFEVGFRSGWADGNKTIFARFGAEFLGA